MATTYSGLAGGWGGVSVSVGRGATLAGGVAAVIGLGVGRLLGMGLVNRSGGYNPGLYVHHADGRLNPTIQPAFATSESAMFLGWPILAWLWWWRAVSWLVCVVERCFSDVCGGEPRRAGVAFLAWLWWWRAMPC